MKFSKDCVTPLQWNRAPSHSSPTPDPYLVGGTGGLDQVGPVLRWWTQSPTACRDPSEGRAGSWFGRCQSLKDIPREVREAVKSCLRTFARAMLSATLSPRYPHGSRLTSFSSLPTGHLFSENFPDCPSTPTS